MSITVFIFELNVCFGNFSLCCSAHKVCRVGDGHCIGDSDFGQAFAKRKKKDS